MRKTVLLVLLSSLGLQMRAQTGETEQATLKRILERLEAVEKQNEQLMQEIQSLRADGGLGLFIRSLVGLDREAAKQAFNAFYSDTSLTANQIEFVNMIVDYLMERGVMDPRLLYESPFTDMNPLGVQGVFGESGAERLVTILDEVRKRAAA